MSQFDNKNKVGVLNMLSVITRFSLALFMVFTLMLSWTAVQLSTANQAQAGALKKGKKGLKLIGKGARFIEKKASKGGKFGKAIAKGARGVRKGTGKASRGITKVQKGINKGVSKVCKRKCKKALKAGRKAYKYYNRVKEAAERKCHQFGRNSKACKVARNALELASPI